MPRPQAPPHRVRRWEGGSWHEFGDQVAAEEPLQLLLDGEPLSIVMRTPGHDLELALGLLYAERVIAGLADVERILISAEAGEEAPAGLRVDDSLVESNLVDVRLRPGRAGRRPERSFLASAACGVCGRTTVADLAFAWPPLAGGPELDPALLVTLPDRLRAEQSVFDATGGLHGAGLFTTAGEVIVAREDVGRHNAVDKVVGERLLAGGLPARQLVLAVSGRAGYELAQKAVAAGIPALVAVGSPSSLAVQVAERFGLTLVGFTRGGRFNVYCDAGRLAGGR